MVQKGCWNSGHGTLKLAVSQERIDRIDWFFDCWFEFKKPKSCFNSFLGRLGQKWVWSLSSWDSAISQDWINELSWFCVFW